MQINIEEWVESYYRKFPIISKALIQYWKTIFELTKLLKPENIRYHQDYFLPLLFCEVGYEDPQSHDGIAGWEIKFFSGNYPENTVHRKTMESAIIGLLEKIPNVLTIQSSVDITPFLDITPDLLLLCLESCNTTKTLSPKIGLCSLKKLHTLYFRGCNDLECIPPEIGNLPNLKYLIFESCSNLKKIPTEIGNLPNLCELRIIFCNNLHTLPDSICKIATFSKIKIGNLPNGFFIPDCLHSYIYKY